MTRFTAVDAGNDAALGVARDAERLPTPLACGGFPYQPADPAAAPPPARSGTLDEAEEIVARARMWRWKPYGEVTLRFAQDAAGQPVELMQDPLHYPHSTK